VGTRDANNMFVSMKVIAEKILPGNGFFLCQGLLEFRVEGFLEKSGGRGSEEVDAGQMFGVVAGRNGDAVFFDFFDIGGISLEIAAGDFVPLVVGNLYHGGNAAAANAHEVNMLFFAHVVRL